MKYLLIFIFNLIILPSYGDNNLPPYSAVSEDLKQTQNETSFTEAEEILTDSVSGKPSDSNTEDNSDEDELMIFLFKEVLPSLKGFQNIQPSFKIQFNEQGMVLEQCSLKFMIEQTQTIRYNVLGLELYDYTSDLEIGQPRFFDIEFLCSGNSSFKLHLSILDAEKNPSLYKIKINSSEGESQVELYLQSLHLNVDIHSSNQEMGMNQKGEIYPTEDMEESLINKKFTAKNIYELNGEIDLLMPVVGKDSVVSKIPSVISISGNIYVSNADEWIPMLDIVSQ